MLYNVYLHIYVNTNNVGASMALETAFVLADELSKTSTHYNDLQLSLTLWQKRRKPRVAQVRKEGHNIMKAYQLENSIAVYARHKLVKLAGSNGMLFSDAFDEVLQTPL